VRLDRSKKRDDCPPPPYFSSRQLRGKTEKQRESETVLQVDGCDKTIIIQFHPIGFIIEKTHRFANGILILDNFSTNHVA
jgi:hypothetical protein